MGRNHPVGHLQSNPPLTAMDQAGHFPHGEVLNVVIDIAVHEGKYNHCRY